ncbi:hypothetical protein [Paraburkholderia terricola]|uniref:hypothetical protein n=1 Tax=Paraburkholderia terricola TaxID=169427 RepID=UPI000DEF985C|nr:hypothetical protein [Paraburkholderia terricola]AXE96113.1 hypothetical protein CUJ90_28225 [Paraburkholderia terricola]
MNISQYKALIADLSRRVPLIVKEIPNGHFIMILTKHGVPVATLSRKVAIEAGPIRTVPLMCEPEDQNADL